MSISFQDLVEVNRIINRQIKYTTDVDLYGSPEFWAIAETEGDCEDFALAKRKLLLGMGWPVEKIRLAICKDQNGNGHAVLTVDYGNQTYVLDNNYAKPKRFQDVPYTWISRQAAGGSSWVKVVNT